MSNDRKLATETTCRLMYVKRHVNLYSNDNRLDASKSKRKKKSSTFLSKQSSNQKRKRERERERERVSPTHQRLQSPDRRHRQLRRRQPETRPNLAFSAVDSKPKIPKNCLQKKKPPHS
ncbi:hypothetical protein TorRG33x02_272720 [Trema orientale]|uniref:Uncharacterized protein n=1 Tax=Trema orientale TaxID=63057 RepID=A0A2P5CUD0_TREOI|nr:hypothetical protein TorRG33x02_272720 [Trema orientale]